MASTALFLMLAVQFGCIITNTGNGERMPKFPAILIFGDSNVDTGIKDTVPPFLQPNISDAELLTGVCFASAGSGYDELTTAISQVISMLKQLELFKDYMQRLKRIVGEKEARRIGANALVIVIAGQNDFLFNYYDIPTRRLVFNITQYQCFVLNKLQNFVKELYDLGCRRIIVQGLPPIGCLPFQITVKSPILRSCIDKENSDAMSYNNRLEKLLPQVQQELPGSKILYADIYTILMDMINNPKKYGKPSRSANLCSSIALWIFPSFQSKCFSKSCLGRLFSKYQ
ncbi:unnamed protein product [Fraxinus pennsylvanica]|uniref:GDSL esterase/lipase n=1 Tax=Fraxinus pennsylvanica TaxID=56036 RepID=A0AAD1ZXQ7_9LAMI|nr:unnamed protein product [Fraxinus pennsylvanica]